MATRLLELYCLEVEEDKLDLPSLRVQAPLYRRGPGYRLGGRLPGCWLLRGRSLDVAPPSSSSLSDACKFIKCLFPLDRHLRGISPLLCLGSFRGGGSCPLIGGCRAWPASRLNPASVDLVRVVPLLVKEPLEEFHRLLRLGLPTVESPAGCRRSRPFGRSRTLWPNTVGIPGTSAGRWLCPWPTRIVIFTTMVLCLILPLLIRLLV
jgi:hypothetical protein